MTIHVQNHIPTRLACAEQVSDEACRLHNRDIGISDLYERGFYPQRLALSFIWPAPESAPIPADGSPVNSAMALLPVDWR